MKIKMSPNVAVRTNDPEGAYNFYREILGFSHRPENPAHTDLDADPLNLFVIKDSEISGPVMELFVEDLEEARKVLLENGCKIIRWEGKGNDCYIEDPYGVMFNLWEQK